MALTTDELLQQLKTLTENTSSNPNMTYKTNALLNKGLNPAYFTSATDTRVVNALNKVYKIADDARMAVVNDGNKFNGVIMDIDLTANKAIWDSVVSLMNESDEQAKTIIEGLKIIFEGTGQKQILGLKATDVGKVLSVVVDETSGKLTTKAIPMTGGGGPITSDDVSYENTTHPEITTVKDAIDFIFGNSTGGPVDWVNVANKPDIGNKITITEDSLILSDNNKTLSSVPIVSNDDIDAIIASL